LLNTSNKQRGFVRRASLSGTREESMSSFAKINCNHLNLLKDWPLIKVLRRSKIVHHNKLSMREICSHLINSTSNWLRLIKLNIIKSVKTWLKTSTVIWWIVEIITLFTMFKHNLNLKTQSCKTRATWIHLSLISLEDKRSMLWNKWTCISNKCTIIQMVLAISSVVILFRKTSDFKKQNS
jgi:hypothetical protein